MVLFVIRHTDDPDVATLLLLLAGPSSGLFLITLSRTEGPLT